MSHSSHGVAKVKKTRKRRRKDEQFSKFIRELRIIRDNIKIIEKGTAQLASYFVNTKNLRKDEGEIMAIVERNRDVATEVQHRLRSVSVENQQLLKMARSVGVAGYGAQARIKRTNRVLRNFVDAVRHAEEVHSQLKSRTTQIISAHEEQLAAVSVGDTHFLVLETAPNINNNSNSNSDGNIIIERDEIYNMMSKGIEFATFDFGDISALSGGNLDLDNNLWQLQNVAHEVEEQMHANHSTLVDVGAVSTDNNEILRHSREWSFGYTTTDSNETRWSSHNTSDASSWYADSINANERIKKKNKKRFRLQRNIAIAVSIIATLGAIALLILYFIKR